MTRVDIPPRSGALIPRYLCSYCASGNDGMDSASARVSATLKLLFIGCIEPVLRAVLQVLKPACQP